jgi:hypothetical protein
MSNVPRGWTTDENRGLADTARWPVLARLPDVSADSIAARSAKLRTPGAIEYRFDPPQPNDHANRTSGPAQSAIRNPQSAMARQPHMFERGRPVGQRGFPRRESSVLPRSNPFSNPRPRLVDSVAPAVRFITMAVLFAAAGIWIQMMGSHASPTRAVEPPQTAAQPPITPGKNAGDHTVPAPTATGPIERPPESGARVGRADGDDFAVHDTSAAGPLSAGRPTVTPPHCLIAAGGHVPRVQISEARLTGVVDDPARDSSAGAENQANGEANGASEADQSPAVARFPGFLTDIPTR